jgi:2-polyprenyl-6-hydroxyphenyl methylase/3-demethylubiquinone-9 3-methyltransferase
LKELNTAVAHAREVDSGERFEFGENWRRFLELLDEKRIAGAEKSLKDMLGVEDLRGKRFVDVGSGSGLFSLAARRLGATVHSLDYDPQSVACTQELRRRYFPEDADWKVEEGSALDPDYLNSLGKFDVVYSWGVLHHTGSMWEALGNVVPLVGDRGKLFIAIYNDQGRPSRYWKKVKRWYNKLPKPLRFLVTWPSFVLLWGRPIVKDVLAGKPTRSFREYGGGRGMSLWRDLVDWVGGYPFEVARPDEIFAFYRDRGFVLTRMTTRWDLGCNEFVFMKPSEDQRLAWS